MIHKIYVTLLLWLRLCKLYCRKNRSGTSNFSSVDLSKQKIKNFLFCDLFWKLSGRALTTVRRSPNTKRVYTLQVWIQFTRVLIPMLIHVDDHWKSMAESITFMFIKVHWVNAGVNKNLIQQLARVQTLIGIKIKQIIPFCFVNRVRPIFKHTHQVFQLVTFRFAHVWFEQMDNSFLMQAENGFPWSVRNWSHRKF